MGVITTYSGRKFVDSEFYRVLARHIVGMASNKIWLYTVDKCEELKEDGESTGKIIIRIMRWRALNDKKNKNIKFWRGRSYNVRSSEEWQAASEIVNFLLDDKMENPNFIIIPREHLENIEEGRVENYDLIQTIKKLRSEKSARNAQLDIFKKRFNLMRANIKEYENVLLKFKSLIDDAKSTETQIHKFIEENSAFWLFGLDYVAIQSKVKFPPGKTDYEFDIMLKRNDNFLDLVELKGPNEKLFDKRTKKRNKPNQKLSEAIGQVFTYLHACDRKKLKNILKPRAMIIIGKEKTDKLEERRVFSSYLNNVELITYTELYKRGKRLLEYIKKTNLSKG